MPPLKCDLHRKLPNKHVSTLMATQDGNNHTVITLRSATAASTSAKNYTPTHKHTHTHAHTHTRTSPKHLETTVVREQKNVRTKSDWNRLDPNKTRLHKTPPNNIDWFCWENLKRKPWFFPSIMGCSGVPNQWTHLRSCHLPVFRSLASQIPEISSPLFLFRLSDFSLLCDIKLLLVLYPCHIPSELQGSNSRSITYW